MGAPLLFLYKMSIVVLIDFISILLTRGIFLIQIVNTNKYLIHFHCTNIMKICFSEVGFLKFQTRFRHSIFISEEKERSPFYSELYALLWIGARFSKKTKLINDYYIYSYTNFERFFDTI